MSNPLVNPSTGYSTNLSVAAAQDLYRDARGRKETIAGEDEITAVVAVAVVAIDAQYVSTANQEALEGDTYTQAMREALQVDIADRREFSKSMDGEQVPPETLDELNLLAGAYGLITVQAIVMDFLPNFNLQLIIDEPLTRPVRSARWHYVVDKETGE